MNATFHDLDGAYVFITSGGNGIGALASAMMTGQTMVIDAGVTSTG